ncbi:hypothetical protein fugu_009316 [Takifugu bimaculatus]|uniref:Uncharacterized protein n=1 Tax=Takifugu bimaculatus TaxID=433685 RepID=A0A4Z2B0Q5_9TELE|nr:hypothetical protein fugu_009316 [Takifugu bimaculatus]
MAVKKTLPNNRLENRRTDLHYPLLPQIHSLWTEKSQRRRFTDAEGVLNSTDGCFLPQQPHFNKVEVTEFQLSALIGGLATDREN